MGEKIATNLICRMRFIGLTRYHGDIWQYVETFLVFPTAVGMRCGFSNRVGKTVVRG
jgi:hypothetical protein